MWYSTAPSHKTGNSKYIIMLLVFIKSQRISIFQLNVNVHVHMHILFQRHHNLKCNHPGKLTERCLCGRSEHQDRLHSTTRRSLIYEYSNRHFNITDTRELCGGHQLQQVTTSNYADLFKTLA